MYLLSIFLHILITTILLSRDGQAHSHELDASSDIGYTCIVYEDDHPKCSGALISRMWVITTCLCVKDTPSTRIYIRIGNPSDPSKQRHVFYKCDKVEVHPGCITSDNEYGVENDLALLQLNEPFFDSRIINIVKIPHHLSYWTPDTGLGLDLTAWTDLNDRARTVREAVWHMNSTIVHPKECEKHFGKKDFKLEFTTCATYWHKGGTDDCKLDVGAPLGFDYELIGILVHKDKCGEQQQLASFVNIPMHSEWIRKTTLKDVFWILL